MRGFVCLLAVLSLVSNAFPAQKGKNTVPVAAPPDILLEGGRKLIFERTLSSELDVRGKRGFWSKLVDVVAGEPEYKRMVRPYGVAVDSRGRIIVSDPGISGVHVFDPGANKYSHLERIDKTKDPMIEPQCVAVDANDNIYVTDSKAGKVFKWNSKGKYVGVFGSLKGGEGYFKRPTGIAVDAKTQHIYVADTLRHRIYVLDPEGRVTKAIGQPGAGNGEFNYPTELLIKNGVLAVVDAMNFRVQLFDAGGNFISSIGQRGDRAGSLFRVKGLAIDSENHVYLVEGLRGTVQVFDTEGRLLYDFGGRGTELGKFQLPTGLFINPQDRVFVVDSYNRRVQVFRYFGQAGQGKNR
ncbi:MAG TPA: 6-bladed beta-propeller [Terriglobales bacterium]|nr:6-bladed beta-propeller [Terriglobales bacterium]